MKRLAIVLFCVQALLAGCATPPVFDTSVHATKPEAPVTDALRTLMLGRWYGDQPVKGGGRRQWLAERFVDGTFRIDFLIETPEGTTQLTEVGFWGVAGGVYFTITRGWLDGDSFGPADPSDPSMYDSYQILEASDDLLRYRGNESGSEFTLRKVGDDFDFPPTET
ncbi:hypothetical protein [Pseudomarimonas arenosa]|uniref:Lipoprotein n=1 Tax=Pseudomarimonas arenosa TaxID=2774145 RepID=A0AAW3ZQ64_9GAMM|nr:hypothetical protein [Pseudomarimonas arenosa]MBD8526431.1 hypothetical protein [Pseudomarimonas arenosa]